MFRSDVTAVSLSGSHRAAGPRPSFQPAVEALEERVVLDGTTDAGQVTYNIAQAVTSLALRLQNANPHLSKKGLGSLLRLEQSFRQIVAGIEATAPQDSVAMQNLLRFFRQADGVLVQEVTALANGHKIPGEVQIQAIGLGQTVNTLNDYLNFVRTADTTSTPAPSCSSASCGM
jgi:hypothetical protein